MERATWNITQNSLKIPTNLLWIQYEFAAYRNSLYFAHYSTDQNKKKSFYWYWCFLTLNIRFIRNRKSDAASEETNRTVVYVSLWFVCYTVYVLLVSVMKSLLFTLSKIVMSKVNIFPNINDKVDDQVHVIILLGITFVVIPRDGTF